MVASPAIMLCHRGVGGDDQIYWSIGVQDQNNYVTWPQRQSLGWRSVSGVSVATLGNVVFCAFIDPDRILRCVRFSKENGTYSWSAPETIGSNMSDRTPHLMNINGQIWCIHRGNDDPHMYYTKRNASGRAQATWTNDVRIGTSDAVGTNCGPAAVIGSDAQLKIVYRDVNKARNGQIMAISTADGGGWSSEYGLAGSKATGSTPCILWHNGVMIFAHTTDDGNHHIQTAALEVGTDNYHHLKVTPNTYFENDSGQTLDGPTLVTLNRRTGAGVDLYMIYRGIGNEGWLYFSKLDQRDPFRNSKWVDERKVGEGNEIHNDYYEVGADSFTYDP